MSKPNNGELFADIKVGTHVIALRNNSTLGDTYGKFLIVEGGEYIWTGTYEGEGRQFAKVIEAQGRNIRRVRTAEWTNFSVMTKDGSPVKDSARERFLTSCLIQDDIGQQVYDNRIAEMQRENDALRSAFGELNQRANNEAECRGYCEDYEDFLEVISKDLPIQMVGRSREFVIPITVNATYSSEVRLYATSRAEAFRLYEEHHADNDRVLLCEAREHDQYPCIDITPDEDGVDVAD